VFFGYPPMLACPLPAMAPWRSAWSPWRSIVVAMLAGHMFQCAAWPSSGGRKEDAIGALLETMSCVNAVSPSGVLAACVQATEM
jgi:hypothetical protein